MSKFAPDFNEKQEQIIYTILTSNYLYYLANTYFCIITISIFVSTQIFFSFDSPSCCELSTSFQSSLTCHPQSLSV